MKRLKSTNQCPPNGWLYTQRETGWVSHLVNPSSQWDYNLLCQSIKTHRAANPGKNLSTSLPAIQEEVMRVNSDRVLAIPGTESYFTDVGSAQPTSFIQAPTQSLQVAVAAMKAISAGAKTILDFEESGEPPVSNELATKRAEICVGCPKNEPGDFTRFFTIPAAARIKSQLERAHEMKLTTAFDNQLNVCSACLCPLKLKPHFPLAFIVKHMSDEVKAKLDSRCWIRHEDNQNAI